MDVPTNGRRRLGFGLFEADLLKRELYRRGVLVHVQDKPFQILALLLEHPGEVVTREELQKKLWSGDTFVEFDEGLNTAIRKLRHALGDSPDNPTFIETVPRQGYRLIASVRVLNEIPADEETGSHRAVLDRSIVLPGAESHRDLSDADQHLTIPSLTRRTTRLLVTVAVLFALCLGFGVGYLRRSRGSQRTMHFAVPLSVAVRDLALSHQGHTLALVVVPRQGGTALWTIEVGGSAARQLENTESASYPFWSPDDRFIAFFADGKLKKIAASGGPVQVICDAPIGRGGTWNRDDVILFGGSGVDIRRVSAAGGQATLVPGFEHKVATTMSNRWPVFLPDGKHFLYTSVNFGADLRSKANGIYVASLDSAERRRIVGSNANAAYVPPGYLLFLHDGTLMAQRFDPDRLQLAGEAFAVANEVEYLSSVARALFSVSMNGTMVYQRGSGATFSQLEWIDREGKPLGILGAPARYANPRLSPSGMRVAADIDDPESSNTDIWVFGLNHQAPLRFTFDPAQDEAPLWSHDGKRILWLSDRGGKTRLYVKDSNAATIQESPTLQVGVELSFASAPSDWAPDGRSLLYTDLQEGDALHLWVLPTNVDRKPYRFLPGASADIEGQFSPDGHWIAYASNESGRWEVYVAPFPGPGGRYQVSTDGGQQPRWRRDGRELFFLSRDRKVMVASVKMGSTLDFNAPMPLFQTLAHEPITAEEFFTYDVSADGQKFLVNTNAESVGLRPLDIVLNWASPLSSPPVK